MVSWDLIEQVRKHPKEVCMTYIDHFKFSSSISWDFLKASGCALVHAVFPCLFERTTSDTVDKIQFLLRRNGCRTD